MNKHLKNYLASLDDETRNTVATALKNVGVQTEDSAEDRFIALVRSSAGLPEEDDETVVDAFRKAAGILGKKEGK